MTAILLPLRLKLTLLILPFEAVVVAVTLTDPVSRSKFAGFGLSEMVQLGGGGSLLQLVGAPHRESRQT